MTELSGTDYAALELCPQHSTCGICQVRADAFSRVLDEKVADTKEPVHQLMRGWASVVDTTPTTPIQAHSIAILTHVLEQLREAVGSETPDTEGD